MVTTNINTTADTATPQTTPPDMAHVTGADITTVGSGAHSVDLPDSGALRLKSLRLTLGNSLLQTPAGLRPLLQTQALQMEASLAGLSSSLPYLQLTLTRKDSQDVSSSFTTPQQRHKAALSPLIT